MQWWPGGIALVAKRSRNNDVTKYDSNNDMLIVGPTINDNNIKKEAVL